MAITAINPQVTEEYTPESERNSDNPTKFKIRGLEEAEKIITSAAVHGAGDSGMLTDDDILIDTKGMEVTDTLDGANNIKDMLEFGLKALEHGGLQGWVNMIDDKKRQVPFKINNKAANLLRIPQNVQQELAREVMNRTSFTEPEAKNSDGLSLSEASPKSSSAAPKSQSANTEESAKSQKTASPTGPSTKKKS